MASDAGRHAILLGYDAERAGDLRAAIRHFRNAEKKAPAAAEPSIALFAATRRAGDLAGAIAAGHRAARKAPDNLELLAGLGHALAEAGETAKSLAVFAQAAATRPADLGALINYANALIDAKRPVEALDVALRANAIAPDSAAPLLSKAQAELALGKIDAAITTLEAAQQREPNACDVRMSLAAALGRAGRWAAGVGAIRAALRQMPDFAPGHLSLGNLLFDLGDMKGAAAAFQRAVDLGAVAGRVNLVQALNYDPPDDPAAGKAAHMALARNLEEFPIPPKSRHASAHEALLRVGFVSPDLHTHSVPHFLESWLAHIDPEKIETVAYSDSHTPDATTERLRAHFGGWRDTRHLNDGDLATHIARDRIDVAIDLAGHTRFNRLAAFAQRLASVQIAWIGYPATTGLRAMDWRLTDAVADPVGASDAHFVERLFRMQHFLCYAPPVDAPDVANPVDGRVVFGSFNNAAKLSQATLDAWAEILQRMPDADLLLKAKALENADAGARLRAFFAERGVAPERLRLLPPTPDRADHLELYGKINIALDPLGYNGTTTTCEALWMGVPVVALRGKRHSACVSASLLHHAGLGELIAETPDEYVAKAVALANDPARLQGYRSMRPRLAQSPLYDAERWVRRFEAGLLKVFSDRLEPVNGAARGPEK
jgi:protein O-GlcNAc transferase